MKAASWCKIRATIRSMARRVGAGQGSRSKGDVVVVGTSVLAAFRLDQVEDHGEQRLEHRGVVAGAEVEVAFAVVLLGDPGRGGVAPVERDGGAGPERAQLLEGDEAVAPQFVGVGDDRGVRLVGPEQAEAAGLGLGDERGLGRGEEPADVRGLDGDRLADRLGVPQCFGRGSSTCSNSPP